MGNRAVITNKNERVGVYLHWNGGRDSVEAFLTYCKLSGFRTGDYGFARLCQVIGNYFGGVTSIGIDTIDRLDCDNGDNGMYIVENWKIVGRKYFNGCEQSNYNLIDMLCDIDECQSEYERLGEEFIRAKEYTPEELSIGDEVYVQDFNERYRKYPIVGNVYDELHGKNFWVVNKWGDGDATNHNNWVGYDELLFHKECKFRAIKH